VSGRRECSLCNARSLAQLGGQRPLDDYLLEGGGVDGDFGDLAYCGVDHVHALRQV